MLRWAILLLLVMAVHFSLTVLLPAPAGGNPGHCAA